MIIIGDVELGIEEQGAKNDNHFDMYEASLIYFC